MAPTQFRTRFRFKLRSFSAFFRNFNYWHFTWLIPLGLASYIITYFFIIYLGWSDQRQYVLDKLTSYKQQLDYMRRPLPAEERAGEVTLGAVAIPSRVYDRNQKLIGEFFSERRTLLPIDKMPEHLINALIASEDRDFYEHEGIDYLAVFRAFIVNLAHLKIAQGGSTLTQQLSKILFTDQERSLRRKIFEYFCAREVEQHYTKREILEMYFNLVDMGHGNYGIESASQFFFGKSAELLSPAESAILVGILPNPKYFSPIHYLGQALKRQQRVLNAMVELKFLTRLAKQKEKSEFDKQWQVRIHNKKAVSRIGKFADQAYRLNLAPYFLDHIRQKLLKKFSSEVITKGGLQIYTTLDYKRQLAAQASLKVPLEKQKKYYDKQIARVQKSLKRLRKKSKNYKRNQERYLKEIATYEHAKITTNGAFITLEPKTGYILTMIGGYEFTRQNQINRALAARRNVGALITPLIYLSALTQKILTPASIVEDAPFKEGKKSFTNSDGKFLGPITTRTALMKSRSVPAVRALKQAGIDDFRHMIAEVFDISFNKVRQRIKKTLAIALGEVALTPLEVTHLYATILNQGKRVKPRDLLRVEDHLGKILWEEDEPPPESTILDPVAAFMTITMLQAVFESEGSAGWVQNLRKKDRRYLPFEIAGKGGTSHDFKEAWFMGMTANEVSTVFIGNDDKVSLGQGRSGAGLGSPVFINYIRTVAAADTPAPFDTNWNLEGTTEEHFCNDSGGVPRTNGLCPHIIKNQIFFEGTEPRSYCPLHLPVANELNLEQ